MITAGAEAHCADVGDPQDCAWWKEQGSVVFLHYFLNTENHYYYQTISIFIFMVHNNKKGFTTLILILEHHLDKFSLNYSLFISVHARPRVSDTVLETQSFTTRWWNNVPKLAVVEVIQDHSLFQKELLVLVYYVICIIILTYIYLKNSSIF